MSNESLSRQSTAAHTESLIPSFASYKRAIGAKVRYDFRVCDLTTEQKRLLRHIRELAAPTRQLVYPRVAAAYAAALVQVYANPYIPTNTNTSNLLDTFVFSNSYQDVSYWLGLSSLIANSRWRRISNNREANKNLGRRAGDKTPVVTANTNTNKQA